MSGELEDWRLVWRNSPLVSEESEERSRGSPGVQRGGAAGPLQSSPTPSQAVLQVPTPLPTFAIFFFQNPSHPSGAMWYCMVGLVHVSLVGAGVLLCACPSFVYFLCTNIYWGPLPMF